MFSQAIQLLRGPTDLSCESNDECLSKIEKLDLKDNSDKSTSLKEELQTDSIIEDSKDETVSQKYLPSYKLASENTFKDF